MRNPSGTHDGERGAVLILVLWVLLALGLLALTFGAAIRTEIDATRTLVDQKRAHYLARAGIDYAVYRILESQMAFAKSRQRMELGPGSVPEVMTGFVSLRLGTDFADVEVVDETGKINLNTAPSHLIYNLLITVGMEPGDADFLTDSIEDWRDPDEFRRPNGAESDYYLSLPQPYFAKNGPFDVTEELLLVRGMTPEIYYGRKGLTRDGRRVDYFGLGKYLTVFSTTNRINVNSAPVPVLAAIPGLTYETALLIDEVRRQFPLGDVNTALREIPGLPTDTASYLSILRSNVYNLISTGRLARSEAVARINAVIRIGVGIKQYAVLYWNEADTEL